MAKRRHQRYDARDTALADNRPPILPVTLSVSDSATLKLLRISPPSSGRLTCAEPSFSLARP